MSANSSYAPTSAVLNGVSSPSQGHFDQPSDLNSYTRAMFQHTQKQMDVASQQARRRSESDGQYAVDAQSSTRSSHRGGSTSSDDSGRSQ